MIDGFHDRIKLFLEKNLPRYVNKDVGRKAIHDPLWGSNLFFPWEIACIDTPLFQRLRRVHQTGTAFLTYPGASHSRFSHSLGVIILADRLLKKLKEDFAVKRQWDVLIANKDIYEVRLAALFHDIGHCFFSHTSEQVFKKLDVFRHIRSEEPVFADKRLNPHEIFSFLILRNEVFLDFWNELTPLFDSKDDVPDLENIAKMIIGLDISPEKRFLREIITGPYDVDKLEYLYRDAYNAGLNIAYDIERYFYRISIEDTSRYSGSPDEKRLVMDLKGVTAIEQLIFSKIMLFSYIYHHQKVRCADCLIREIVMTLLSEDHPLIKIDHPCDFLNYNDYDILSSFMANGDDPISELVRKLQTRQLLKRCFIVCREYVEGIENDQDVSARYERLCTNMRDIFEGQIDLRNKLIDRINEKTGGGFGLKDVYIDLPDVPALEDTAAAPVKLPSGEIRPMSDYFQLEGWQKLYELKKLRGYFFINPQIVEIANEVIQELLLEEYGLSFSPLASQMAKVAH